MSPRPGAILPQDGRERQKGEGRTAAPARGGGAAGGAPRARAALAPPRRPPTPPPPPPPPPPRLPARPPPSAAPSTTATPPTGGRARGKPPRGLSGLASRHRVASLPLLSATTRSQSPPRERAARANGK